MEEIISLTAEIIEPTYRWEVQSEKEVIVPEATYELNTGGQYSTYHGITSNISQTDMKELYADGAVATFVLNGVTYNTKAFHLDGGMDTVWGFGNPKIANWNAEASYAEDTGEPFAIWFAAYGTQIFCNSDITTLTISAYIEGEQTLVSVGKNDNPLTTLEGGIVNGVFNNARYQLATPFKLLHDKDWAVEWKSIGACDNPGAMAKIWDETGLQTSEKAKSIIYRHTNTAISLSECRGSHYHYGVNLSDYGIDYAAEHIYRLQNKVNADGTNMVWLYADGKEIAPLTKAYGAGTGTSDWVSGKDFSFGYMGTPRYILNGFIMDDIAVWESGASEVFPDKPENSTGKDFLLHQMFGKVFANAMTGKFFWFACGGDTKGVTVTVKNE